MHFLNRIIRSDQKIRRTPTHDIRNTGEGVSSGKSTDVTCKTHLGYLAAQLPWLVDLASLVCDMNCWLSRKVSALQTVVAGSISSGGDYAIHCWLDLIRSNIVRRYSADFLVMVIQFTILIHRLKNMYNY